MCVCVFSKFVSREGQWFFVLEGKQFVTKSWAKNCTLPVTAEEDAEFADAHFGVSKSEKRLVRATIESYEKTGSYIFLNLFTKDVLDYEFQQRITLTPEEFEKLVKKSPSI